MVLKFLGIFNGCDPGYTKFWKVDGSASVDDSGLHFRPQSTKSAGHVWSTLVRESEIFTLSHGPQPVMMTSWEVLLEFNQHGDAPLSTGEGLAFWHVSHPTFGTNGPVYGHSDQFAGLGIFFDSYDADGNVNHTKHTHTHMVPRI